MNATPRACPDCGGHGWIAEPGPAPDLPNQVPCERCHGTGEEAARDERPFCECGNCDATGRNGGDEVRLPMDAWAVAGEGDDTRIAVLPAHVPALIDREDLAVEWHEGWAAVGPHGL